MYWETQDDKVEIRKSQIPENLKEKIRSAKAGIGADGSPRMSADEKLVVSRTMANLLTGDRQLDPAALQKEISDDSTSTDEESDISSTTRSPLTNKISQTITQGRTRDTSSHVD